MKNVKRRIIYVTLEPCSRLPGGSGFGRLSNQACEKKEEKSNSKCNLRHIDFCCDKLHYGRGRKDSGAWRQGGFVPKKDIQPFEQLMFDYGEDMS